MNFCFKCGASLSGKEKFCPRCGQKFSQASACTPADHKPRNCSRHGVIFTDLPALCRQMSTTMDVLVKLFDKYIEAMVQADVDYRLVDVSNYRFGSKAAGRKGQMASVDALSPWWDYQHILYDILCYEKENALPESNYLFIIGGSDVIPMPVINHYLKNEPKFHDKDIETDILYSYPYGPHTQQALETTELFTQEMYFFAGRLPIPKGAGISYLVNYLQNAINCRNGLQVSKIYAQTDPHWKDLTAWLMSPYNKAGMLPDRSNISGHYSYGNVMLGPDITSKFIRAVMETDTDFIYLNLHGSDDPEQPYYAGEYPDHTCQYDAIFPVSAMLIPERYNVFVAEACYGGRFIGYDQMHSMIQAGLSHKTVIAMASSRIAFGGCMAPGGNADLMCGKFTDYLLSGYCAGDALVMARSEFFDESGMLSPHEAATLAEFNLFGDPTLSARIVLEDGAKMGKVSRNVAPKDFPCGYQMETLKSADKPQSLLDQVRGAVDANIMAISKAIGDELYAKYGLPPREPETISRLKYKNGKQRLVYKYMNGKSSWVVTSTPEGKIESVMTSK